MAAVNGGYTNGANGHTNGHTNGATNGYHNHANQIVNRWNDFDPLEEIVLGRADGACFNACEPGCQSEFSDQSTTYGPTMSHPFNEYLPWPTGPKLKRFVNDCNEQLEGMRELLEGEGITVRRPDLDLCNDFPKKYETPDFTAPNGYCAVCPRDVVMTIGNEVVEAPMSKRSRYFEFRPLRPLIKEYFDKDEMMIWTAAPKPLMRDSSYTPEFWDRTHDERMKRVREKYEYCLSEEEVMFDAADCLLLGDMMFVQQSCVTNLAGIKWLRKHFAQKGIRVETLHFPSDLYPAHIDCTFVAVRPGLVLTNPERQPLQEEMGLFKQNDWRMVDVPFYSTEQEHPVFCQSSRWLSMNVLSLNHNKLVVEAGETKLINFLEQEHGFDVCPIPYRKVFEFGGSLHCSTWDVRRTGGKKNYFENRECLDKVNGVMNGVH